MARVLVTGGSGLIGGALIDRLRCDGHDVVALARSAAAADAVHARGAEVARGDIGSRDSVRAAARGCELVYHVAGVNTLCPRDPSAMLAANVDGAANVAYSSAAEGVRRLIHTSSAAALGEAHGSIGREDSPHRGSYLSTYERSKHLSEAAVLDAAGDRMEVVLVNPASVQGPGRAGGTGKLLIAFLDGRLRVIVDTHISVVDIDDCVAGHVLAAQHGRPGERYVLCGATVTIGEAIELARELFDVPGRPRVLPGSLALAGAGVVELACRLGRREAPLCREMVRTMLHGHRYDGSRAQRELGLRYTPLADTLRRTAAWAMDAGLMRPRPARPAAGTRAGSP